MAMLALHDGGALSLTLTPPRHVRHVRMFGSRVMRCSLLGQPALLPDYVWIPLKASPALLLLASVTHRFADPLPGNGARGRKPGTKPGVEATTVRMLFCTVQTVVSLPDSCCKTPINR